MKKIKKICILTAVFSVVFLFYSGLYIFAENITWQKNNSAILSNNSIVEDGLRWIAWGITKVLCMLADVAETLYDKTFGMIDITKYAGVNSLIVSFRPVIVALIVLCTIGLGISYIVMQQKVKLVRNILITGLVLSSSVFMFSTANDLINNFRGAVLTESRGGTAYSIVNNNLIDLVAVDKSGNISGLNYKNGSGVVHNAGVKNASTFSDVKITEVLNWDDKEDGQDLYGWSDTLNNYLRYKAIKIQSAWISKEVNSGTLGTTIGNEFYYRYYYDFWGASLEICAIVLLYIALSYKNVRIAYELIIARFLAMFYSADIGSGERLKQILFFIRDTYVALAISIVSVKLYLILTESITSFGITGLGKGLVALFIAYAVIDGPNLAQRILGIDAGLSSSVGRAFAVLQLAKVGTRIAGGAIKYGSKTGMALATGKSAQERKIDSGNANMGERFGKYVNGKMNDDKSKERGKVDSRHNAKTASDDIKNKDNEGINFTEKGGYKNIDFMNENQPQTGKADIDSGESTSNFNNEVNSNPDFMSGGNSSKADSGTTFMNSNAKNEIKDNTNISRSNNNTSIKRFSNPEFKNEIHRLKPDKSASLGERRDFNRQVTNLIKGDHRAIKPEGNDRAGYKERNYQKARKLEKIYHKEGDRGDLNGTK